MAADLGFHDHELIDFITVCTNEKLEGLKLFEVFKKYITLENSFRCMIEVQHKF